MSEKGHICALCVEIGSDKIVKPKCQGTGLFRELYRWLEKELSAGLASVEAYSNKNNVKSQKILECLGLSRIGENKSGSSYHYRGTCRDLWGSFR